MLDVLVVAPHPDDAELAMGGSILKFREEGLTVGVVDLTSGEPTPFGSPEIRARETAAATEVLALDWRQNLGLPNRSLQPTLEARAKLAGVFRETRPRWIFTPYWEDAHPDHLAATELTEAARFWSKLTKTEMPGEPYYPPRLFYYFCFHLRHIPQPAFIVDISGYWERKRAALECYHSQLVQGRSQGTMSIIERLRDQASVWGFTIGTEYGEGFAAREPLGLRTLSATI